MRIKRVSSTEVEYTAHRLAVKFMTWDEPIPSFGSRFPNILESCLNTPFQTFHRRNLYRGLIGKAAILFYLMIKNHPFENGNKRIAVMSLLLLLYKNGRWLNIDNEELYRLAQKIAKSHPKAKDHIIVWIEMILKNNTIKFPE